MFLLVYLIRLWLLEKVDICWAYWDYGPFGWLATFDCLDTSYGSTDDVCSFENGTEDALNVCMLGTSTAGFIYCFISSNWFYYYIEFTESPIRLWFSAKLWLNGWFWLKFLAVMLFGFPFRDGCILYLRSSYIWEPIFFLVFKLFWVFKMLFWTRLEVF